MCTHPLQLPLGLSQWLANTLVARLQADFAGNRVAQNFLPFHLRLGGGGQHCEGKGAQGANRAEKFAGHLITPLESRLVRCQRQQG